MSKKLMMTKFVIAFGGKKYLLLDQNYVNHVKRVSSLEIQGTYPTVAFELIFR